MYECIKLYVLAGPNVADTDDYPGLYKFNYYLFSPGSFVNVVQHNVSHRFKKLSRWHLVIYCPDSEGFFCR